jgi:DNA-binding LacI/PurR family transcriptional regulator
MASGTVRTRLAGYEQALTAAGLDWRAVPVAEAPENRVERGAEATRDLLERHPETTAVLAVSDQLALGALAAARAIGRAVPDELSVVGFDDVPAASWARPGLTTVRQPLLEKGEVAGRMLVDPDAPREVVLPIELVVRGSTAAAPG